MTNPYHPVFCPSKTMWPVQAGKVPDAAKEWLKSKAPAVAPKPKVTTPPNVAKPVVKSITKSAKASTVVKKEDIVKEVVKKESIVKEVATEESIVKEVAKKGPSQASRLVTYLANNMVDNRWGI